MGVGCGGQWEDMYTYLCFLFFPILIKQWKKIKSNGKNKKQRKKMVLMRNWFLQLEKKNIEIIYFFFLVYPSLCSLNAVN